MSKYTDKDTVTRYQIIIAAIAQRSGGELQLTQSEVDSVIGLSMDIWLDEGNGARVVVGGPKEQQ